MTLPAPADTKDWRALILGLFFLGSIISLLGISILMAVFAAKTAQGPDRVMTLTLFLFSGGLFLATLLLIPGAYLNGRKFLRLPEAQLSLPAFNEELVFLGLAALWISALVLGQAAASNPLGMLALPFINSLAIGLPIIFFLKVALRKLDLPLARDGWSVFGITLVYGPVAGIVLEGLALVVFIFGVGMYSAKDPALAQRVADLAVLLKGSTDSERLITTAAPILFSSGGILMLLGLFSVAVPAIEEAIKVSVLWLIADRIKHPAQGFALGIICGAAFALAENLGFSSTGAGDWLSTAALRAGSPLPHMLNSGILGWALVSAWKNRSYLRLGVAYAAVMLIHGAWNGISVAIWLNSISPYAQNVPHLLMDPVPFFAGWIALIIGAFLGLMYCNRRLRPIPDPQSGYNEPHPRPLSGEDHD